MRGRGLLPEAGQVGGQQLHASGQPGAQRIEFVAGSGPVMQGYNSVRHVGIEWLKIPTTAKPPESPEPATPNDNAPGQPYRNRKLLPSRDPTAPSGRKFWQHLLLKLDKIIFLLLFINLFPQAAHRYTATILLSPIRFHPVRVLVANYDGTPVPSFFSL